MTPTSIGLKVLASTLLAAGLAYYAIASVNVSGLAPSNWTAANIIQTRCPVHLVAVTWTKSNDQADILFRWATAETTARLGVVGTLWLLAMGFLVNQHLRTRRKVAPEAAA